MRWRSCIVLWSLALLLSMQPAYAGGTTGTSIETIQPLIVTNDPTLDLAQRYALQVLAEDFNGQVHSASNGYYSNPWIRDSFAWGMIPIQTGPSLTAYSTTEVQYWLKHQQKFGGWITAPKSGYFDETPIFISAVLSAYQLQKDRSQLLDALPEVERGWTWLAKSYIDPARGSKVLLYANVPPHVATDWVDQIARTGYATQLEALWYKATVDLSTMESLTGHAARGRTYARFAAQIKKDINRLLWTDSAPYVYGAAPVGAFGHYRSWRGPRDYFELDSNFLCVLYGIASPAQTETIVGFVQQHAGYLLALSTPNGVPARVVYGDYAPADYSWKRNQIGQERYQNAFWPSVGALVALGLLHAGDSGLAHQVLDRIGTVVAEQGDFREWYRANGMGQGAPHFQWAARLFLVAVVALTR